MAEPITEISLVLLTLAVIVFATQVVRQLKAGQLVVWSFSTVLLIVLIGWLSTEILSDLTGQVLGGLGEIVHFAVMLLFAVTLTLQLRNSFKS